MAELETLEDEWEAEVLVDIVDGEPREIHTRLVYAHLPVFA